MSAAERKNEKGNEYTLSKGTDNHIDQSVCFRGIVDIGDSCFISQGVIIGHSAFYDLECPQNVQSKTVIGNSVIIHPNAIISNGVTIGDQVRIGPSVTIWRNSVIGNNTELMYNAQVHENVNIGNDCVIAGFLCDHAKVGNSVAVFGSLVHPFRKGWIEDPNLAHESPTIEDDVVVSCGATVIGPVILKSRTYVAAGAIVTKSTPGNCKIIGVDKIEPLGNLKCLKG
jgi:UDP-3-O-[3-hydroxymyristoyl] glucosamine N-acyltransferase